MANEVLASAMFWWYLIIASSIALAPAILLRILKNELFPTLLEDVKLCESKAREKDIIESIKRQFSKKEEEEAAAYPEDFIPPLSSRSSYAFSHEEGFGKLISSGKYLGASAVEVENERTLRRNTWMTVKSKPLKQTDPDKSGGKQNLIQSSLRGGLSAGLGVIIGASGGVSLEDEQQQQRVPSPHEGSTTPLIPENKEEIEL